MKFVRLIALLSVVLSMSGCVAQDPHTLVSEDGLAFIHFSGKMRFTLLQDDSESLKEVIVNHVERYNFDGKAIVIQGEYLNDDLPKKRGYYDLNSRSEKVWGEDEDIPKYLLYDIEKKELTYYLEEFQLPDDSRKLLNSASSFKCFFTTTCYVEG